MPTACSPPHSLGDAVVMKVTICVFTETLKRNIPITSSNLERWSHIFFSIGTPQPIP